MADLTRIPMFPLTIFPLPGEMTIYVPFGPENVARYLRLAEAEDLTRVYFDGAKFDS